LCVLFVGFLVFIYCLYGYFFFLLFFSFVFSVNWVAQFS